MSDATCSVEGCGRGGKLVRGWCDLHYRRWRKHGDPLVSSVIRGADPVVRFWAKVERTSSCWVWTGAMSGGYGSFRVDGAVMPAHRYSYQLHGGILVAGMHIDHLCRNRACVNPAHLEQVTPRTNILRGVGAAAQAARKTHCPQGHEYTPENTYREPANQRHRQCITCIRAKSKVNGALEAVPLTDCPVCGTPFRARKQGTNKDGRQRTCSYPCSVVLRYGGGSAA